MNSKQGKIKEVKAIHQRTGDVKKTEKEFKTREKERNEKRKKKMDFRAIARKLFKDHSAELPQPISGYGAGMKAFCFDCKRHISKYNIKYSDTGERIATCGDCGSYNIKLELK